MTIINVIDGVDGYTPDMLRKRRKPWLTPEQVEACVVDFGFQSGRLETWLRNRGNRK